MICKEKDNLFTKGQSDFFELEGVEWTAHSGTFSITMSMTINIFSLDESTTDNVYNNNLLQVVKLSRACPVLFSAIIITTELESVHEINERTSIQSNPIQTTSSTKP